MSETIYHCDECDWSGTPSEMDAIDDVDQRVMPGELFPPGQCPKCGALIGVADADVPDHTIDTCVQIRTQRTAAQANPA